MNQRLERARVDLLTLVDIDRAPCVAIEARVEELGGVVQGRALHEGQLHGRLVRLAGADDAVVRPDRGARVGSFGPLPLLHNVRVRLPDQLAHPAQGLPAQSPSSAMRSSINSDADRSSVALDS